MTVLLSIAVVVLGAFCYFKLPIAALPSYDTPVINVTGSLPGASPEVMAASVATTLENNSRPSPSLDHQFQQHAGQYFNHAGV